MKDLLYLLYSVLGTLNFLYLLNVIKHIACRKIEKDIIAYDKRIRLTMAERGMLHDATVMEEDSDGYYLMKR